MAEQEVGVITHYFSHIGVAIVQVTDTIQKGDTLHIKGHTTDFNFKVDSMQIDKKEIPEANSGDDIGIKVPEKVHAEDMVYKIIE